MFLKINKVIRIFIFWNMTMNFAAGLLAPVFAIFVLQNITGGDIAQGARVAGFAMLFYWVIKGLLQIPIGLYLDRNHGEIDDFWFFVAGTIITGLVQFGFLFSSASWHIYVLQIVHAIGMAMVIPSSLAIYIRHTDRGNEAFESSLNSTLLGFGVGISSAIGGIIASYGGFNLIFILTGSLTLFSVFLLLTIRKDVFTSVPRGVRRAPRIHEVAHKHR